MTTAELRPLILAHLGTHENVTAKHIAEGIGHAEYPGFVVNALNVLRSEGLVDARMKAKVNHYFLVKHNKHLDVLKKENAELIRQNDALTHELRELCRQQIAVAEGLRARLERL